MKNEKMIKTAAILDKIAKILGSIVLVCGFVCLVFVPLVIFLGERVFVPGSNVLELGFIEFKLSADFQAITPGVVTFSAVSLVIAATSCFILYFIAKFLRAVLLSVKEGRPFENAVVSSFRRLGFLSLVGGLVSELLKWGQQLLLLKAYPMDEIFASPAITGMEVNFIMDMGFVVIALVFFILSRIFAYGHELQKQSDETL